MFFNISPLKVGNLIPIPLSVSLNPYHNDCSTLLAIFLWNSFIFRIKAFTPYLSLQFWLKCKKSHGEIFCPSISKKKCHGKLQWHCFDLESLENVLTMELFQLIKTKAVMAETLLVFFWGQASVSEILCLNRTKFVFDKITRLFQCLHSYYRNVANFE